MKKRHGICQAKSFWLLAGIAIITLMAMFALAGCKTEADDNGALDLAGTIKIQKGGVDVTAANTGDTLTAAYSGTETGITYQWKKGGTNVATGQTYTPTTTGSYTVTVSATGYNPKTSAAVTVTQLQTLTGSIKIQKNGADVTEANTGDTLTAVYSGTETGLSFSYQWSKGGTAIASGGTGQTYQPAEVGSYTVTVSATGYNPKSSAAVTVNAVPNLTDTIVNIAAIAGVTPPATGGTPVTAITETAQYTGTVAWNGNPSTFAASTAYTATITLTAKAGYTLQGVAANFFTVAGATATNPVNSGVIQAVFPATAGGGGADQAISIAAIAGVTAPVTGAAPVTAITETAQYTGTVAWNGNPSTFAGETAYTATITLTAKTGYTLQGVAANFFTVAEATATNPVNSGVVTAVFPATAAVVSIAAIPGVTAPVTGAAPVTAITETAQYTGTVAWNPAVSGTFAGGTVYTATITLTAKTGYTLQGVAADSFTVAGATATNPVNSGVVQAVFPQTAATVTITAIAGVTPPVTSGIPVTTITETDQYTGTILWTQSSGNPAPSTFAAETEYMATITLTVKTGYTCYGAVTGFFTVAGASSVSYFNNSNRITARFPQTDPYIIGDIGPGGGKIFYISEAGFTYYTSATDTTGVTAHYLEAAPSIIVGTKAWASSSFTSTNITGTATGIGTGRRNTLKILATDATAPAALACKNYTNNGKSDWFLPSQDERNQLYINRDLFDNWGTSNLWWTSSQYSNEGAWLEYFTTGNQSNYGKTVLGAIRAVRAF
jgi:hypothetical protein